MAVQVNSLLAKNEMPEGELHGRAKGRANFVCLPPTPAFRPSTMSANHDPIQDTAATSAMPGDAHNDHHEKPSAPLPIIVYTRSQLLSLHNSPLVKPPSDMPELKDWFGYVYMLPTDVAFVFIS